MENGGAAEYVSLAGAVEVTSALWGAAVGGCS